MKVHSFGTSKFIPWHTKQLNNDLKKEILRKKKLPKNQKELIKWHETLEEATKDATTQRSRQCPFDNMKRMAKVAKDLKINLRISYSDRSKNG